MRRNDFKYWKIRSANFDKLFWIKDKKYIKEIIRFGNFKKNHLVLDVGTGSGVMARAVKPFVKHIIAIDISTDMISKGKWEDISIVKWDICEEIFINNLFDRIIARMVFHHIIDNLEKGILRCYDLLKPGGKLIIAEGIPPSDDKEIVKWYSEMFKLKENRLIFRFNDLILLLKKMGFKNISYKIHIMKRFNVNNWLINSGLCEKNIKKILKMHFEASEKIKKAYNMKIINKNCFIDTKNLIISGEK